jgi:hypothetical protein
VRIVTADGPAELHAKHPARSQPQTIDSILPAPAPVPARRHGPRRWRPAAAARRRPRAVHLTFPRPPNPLCRARYGPGGGGLLRLHSTYRHDLKIYSSDEGRVQMSAAAFTKGLLDLEGSSLTPILVSLVKKDASMLDAFGKVRPAVRPGVGVPCLLSQASHRGQDRPSNPALRGGRVGRFDRALFRLPAGCSPGAGRAVVLLLSRHHAQRTPH